MKDDGLKRQKHSTEKLNQKNGHSWRNGGAAGLVRTKEYFQNLLRTKKYE